MLAGSATLYDYVAEFFAPTVLGNIAGGIVMVSVLNHGAIKPEIEERLGDGERQEKRNANLRATSRAGKPKAGR